MPAVRNSRPSGAPEAAARGLGHRVRNTLATVLSIANRTLSRAESLDEFSRSFRGRIQALAAALTLLTAVNWNVTALRVLVEQALRPYASSDGSNVQDQRRRGPPCDPAPR